MSEPVFRTSVTLIVNCTVVQLNRWMRRNADPSEKPLDPEREADTIGMTMTLKNKEGLRCRLIWLPKFSGHNNELAILSHEIFHLIAHVAEGKSIPFSFDNQESLAYLYEFYFGAALKVLVRKKHK